jgi:hypothetical protein
MKATGSRPEADRKQVARVERAPRKRWRRNLVDASGGDTSVRVIACVVRRAQCDESSQSRAADDVSSHAMP